MVSGAWGEMNLSVGVVVICSGGSHRYLSLPLPLRRVGEEVFFSPPPEGKKDNPKNFGFSRLPRVRCFLGVSYPVPELQSPEKTIPTFSFISSTGSSQGVVGFSPPEGEPEIQCGSSPECE